MPAYLGFVHARRPVSTLVRPEAPTEEMLEPRRDVARAVFGVDNR